MQLFMVSFYNGEWYEDSDWYIIGVFSTKFDADMHGIGYVATKKEEFSDCKYDVQEITLNEGWCP